MSKKKAAKGKPGKSKAKDENGEDVVHTIAIDGMYEDWFLDYASYVILERAVPRIEDGFKAVSPR